MTKRKVLAIIIALVTCVTLLCACSTNQSANEEQSSNSNEIITSDEEQPSYSSKIIVSDEGSYFLFRTDSGKEYINFLESLDKEIYEIVDITLQPTTYYHDDCFMITYTKKAQ